MLPETIFTIIISIIVFDFLFERYLDYINIKHIQQTLPFELSEIYDAEQYKKQQNYKRDSNRFGLIASSISFIAILLMFFLEGFAFVNKIALSISDNPLVVSLLFFGILGFASDVLSTPFTLYDTFVIEEKYGFNKTTPKTFVLDKLKGWALGIVVGGGILALVIWFYQVTGELFWLYTWILVTIFSIFMNMFYSSLIVPLFNKQTPLPEGELRQKIESFSINAGFKLSNIYVIDGSKRSTKANAYFSGLGATKRIVLYDTLVDDLTHDEIVAVLAHEIGHYKKKHTLSGLIFSIIQTGITLFILSLFINSASLSQALGVASPSFHIALVAFGILYSPISTLIGLGMNAWSRKNEYAADAFAAIHQQADHLISSLKKLASKNLSNLTPHPAYVFVYYSHPTLLQRIRSLKKHIS